MMDSPSVVFPRARLPYQGQAVSSLQIKIYSPQYLRLAERDLAGL